MYPLVKFMLEKDEHRHWSAESEPFTGGDALQSALEQGWVMVGHVSYREFDLRESRKVAVFYFRLQRDERTMEMPVIGNPHVLRVIAAYDVPVMRPETGAPVMVIPGRWHGD